MTKADLDAVNKLLDTLYRKRERYSHALAPRALSTINLNRRIARWEAKRDQIETWLADQYDRSNGLDVVQS